MTKISFDVDFSQDPEKILQEIQKRAEAEVAKREAKDKEAIYLSKLHEVVNKEIGSDYKNINALIRALTKYASPSVRDRIENTSPTGRRKTVSMDKETYDRIQTLLAKPNPNKAGIARETGVSVVQVRKVADGGYDKKFGGVMTVGKAPAIPSPKLEEEIPAPSLPPIEENSAPVEEPVLAPLPPIEEVEEKEETTAPLPAVSETTEAPEEPSIPEPAALDLPPPPSFGDDSENIEEDTNDLPTPPAPLEEPSLPPAELPPAPSFGDEPSAAVEEESNELPPPPAPLDEPVAEASNELPPLPPAPLDEVPLPPTDLPPPPSFGETEEPSMELPPPPAPPSLDEVPEDAPPAALESDGEAPPAPPSPLPEDLPPAPPAPLSEDVPPAPPAPPSDAPAPPPAAPPAPSSPPKPSLSGKPSLSLKKGKSKTKGLKLTRPPLKKKLPPLN